MLLEYLYPGRCPVCDGIVVPLGNKICRGCIGKLRYVTEPRCIKCGKQLREEGEEFCADCSRVNHYFDAGLTLYEYESVRKSIYRFKYEGRREYADFYGRDLAERLGERIRLWKPDVLVPVPMYPAKVRKRGYNQAELIADSLGKSLGIPVDAGIVVRQRNTTPQKELSNIERQNNLKKAFIIARNDVKLDTIMIIDDIYTTGSTIDAVSKEFRRCGIKKIYYVALASGNGF